MAEERRRAALGFRHHTGWAIMLAIAGDPSNPQLVDRRRLNLMGSDLPREAYHVAAGLPAADGQRLVSEAMAGAELAARIEIARVKAELEEQGYQLRAAGLAADVRRLPPLERILPVHILRHSAEGEMFRSALAEACSEAGLEVVNTSPKDISTLTASQSDMSEVALTDVLTRMGREAGPPWQRDHREATMAAMLALSTAP
jgi:hypothetical protein